jgi:hypothetical protein
MRSYRIVISVVATGALALASAAPALAAAHGRHGASDHRNGGHRLGTAQSGRPNTHGNAHGNAHGSRDRLTGPRGAARHVLSAQAARLTRILEAVDVASALNPADQAALLAALQTDLGALAADLDGLPQASSVHELNAVKHDAVRIVTLAARQVSVTLRGDALEAQAADRAATVADLLVQLAMAADTGHPAPGAQAALDDAQAQLDTATSDAKDAVSGILALAPSASRSDMNAACDAADEELLDGQDALAAADADIATANTALGN